MIRWPAILLAAAALAGCASPAFLSTGAPEAEARRTLGQPSMELENPDGSRQLVYPTGPQGTQTFMVHLGKEGTVQRVEQVLTEETFMRIRTGTTTGEEVRRMLGPPWRVVRFDNLGANAWDYRFRDAWGYLADFSVMIDDRGVVASKFTARIEPRDSGGFNR